MYFDDGTDSKFARYTYLFHESIKNHLGDRIVHFIGISTRTDDVTFKAYYQWVPFVLMFQVITDHHQNEWFQHCQ